MHELIVYHKGETVLREGLSDAVTIGSAPDNDIRLTEFVSPHHARICLTDDGITLTGLQGAVFVNGRRITGSTRLESGDAFDAGAYRFQLMETSRTAKTGGAKGVRDNVVPLLQFLHPVKRRMRQTRLILGRSEGCDLVINDPFASFRHAEIFVFNGAYHIRDLHSRNGTYVNDCLISERPLPASGVIRIGKRTLAYKIEAPPELPPEGITLPPLTEGALPRTIVGRSAVFRELIKKLERVAATDDSVLLIGETGTGKDLLAHFLHCRNKGRMNGPFVVVNCAAIPDTLAESQLFGHMKGAFTGAVESHKGFFEQALNGTLFLNEIAELSTEGQARLLQAIEDDVIRPIGSVRERAVDIRLIAATNRDVITACASGKFREDLYARFDWVVKVPPLRERLDDIPFLVNYFLRESSPTVLDIGADAIAFLQAQEWRGNVRGVHRAVRRAITNAISRNSTAITIEDFELCDGRARPKPSMIRRAKRASLPEKLKVHSGNVSEVSRILGISRLTIRKWLKQDGLDIREFRK